MNKTTSNLGPIVNGNKIGFKLGFDDAKTANLWKQTIYRLMQACQYDINNSYGVYDNQETRSLIGGKYIEAGRA